MLLEVVAHPSQETVMRQGRRIPNDTNVSTSTSDCYVGPPLIRQKSNLPALRKSHFQQTKIKISMLVLSRDSVTVPICVAANQTKDNGLFLPPLEAILGFNIKGERGHAESSTRRVGGDGGHETNEYRDPPLCRFPGPGTVHVSEIGASPPEHCTG